MPTPSLYPVFMKAQSGGGGGQTIFVDSISVDIADSVATVDVDEPSVDIDGGGSASVDGGGSGISVGSGGEVNVSG